MKSTTQYTAHCECGEITIANRRIANYWSHKKCNKCEKKLCVFQDNTLIYDYNNIIFTASCRCGALCFKNKQIPTHWSQMKCQKCESKLMVKDPSEKVIHNYQSKLKTIKPKQLAFQNKDIKNEQQLISPIKNDIFMGYCPFEQFPSHNMSIEEIDNAIDTLLQLEIFFNKF